MHDIARQNRAPIRPRARVCTYSQSPNGDQAIFRDDWVMKFVQRIKAYFGWDSHREADASMAQDDAQASSRLKQNLVWMPTFEALKPLDLPPPACPPLGLSTGQLVSRYRAYIAQVETLDTPVANEALRVAGRRLARDLLEKAIDLSSSKAQELSQDIYWLMQSAALASLFADGPQSDEFVAYRNHVHYYKDAALMTAQVGAFDLYVTSRNPRKPAQLVGESEIQSSSPDGHYCVQVTPWEARNSLWVYPPRIIDTRQGICVFRFSDACWSADQSNWLTPTTVELKLRKFPGDRMGQGVRVVVDCDGRVARWGSGKTVELSDLESALEAFLNEA
ncbi:hypothetical protein [Pseudomonas frederiksbergensis]|uniref:hypothetical protein n=1 Tax=Pseudomonas frederiksbergensis TaxID=104087 RepID=UPI000FF4D6F0|nr:hypothetical protein [Pseudomonas frederiksbergensis]RON48273.1 hypothetical protein BK667_21165 [Pseudomonas frederiksbergensis]